MFRLLARIMIKKSAVTAVRLGGPHSTMDSVLACRPAASGSILGQGVPKFLDVAVRFIDSQHCLVLVDSAKKCLIVDRTHPVLVRAVLQKNYTFLQKHKKYS